MLTDLGILILRRGRVIGTLPSYSKIGISVVWSVFVVVLNLFRICRNNALNKVRLIPSTCFPILQSLMILVFDGIHSELLTSPRARGGVVVKALRYKPKGRGFDSRWCNLGSTQPLTEMSTRCISWSKGGRCVRLTTLPPSCAIVMKSGKLNFLKPSGPLQAFNGTALPYTTFKQPKRDVCLLSTHCSYMFQKILTVNNDYFPTKH